MKLFRRLASLRITVKFSLAFGLLLITLLLETIIGYGALTVVWESNEAILANAQMQRLAMGMSRNWESVKHLQRSFFAQSPIIGVDQAYNNYALSAGSKITEVIRDGATLKRLVTASQASDNLRAREADLMVYLSKVSQYASVFEEATDHEFNLESDNSGLRPQLEQKADLLFPILQASAQPSAMIAAYFEMRFHEIDKLSTLQSPPRGDVFEAASRLRQSIETSSMPDDERESALSFLDEYENIAVEIDHTSARIQEKRELLDALDQSIEPVLIKLMVSIETEVGLARLQIDATRQVALRVLVGSTLFGLLSAGIIGILLHYTVTRNIINLTRVASQFHDGNLDARTQIDSSDEIGKLANTFDEMAAAVKSLNAELREQAIRDSLTGLFNRRYLDETLSRELARASRDGTHITLVMIDLDHLKERNDVYGHSVGDQILTVLGHLLRSQSRVSDIACRFGGDEFIILLLGAKLEEGVRRAEEWRQAFGQLAVPYKGELIQTTLSIGVVEWTPGENSAALFSRVDAALYTAKNKGRNQIAVLPSSDSDKPGN